MQKLDLKLQKLNLKMGELNLAGTYWRGLAAQCAKKALIHPDEGGHYFALQADQ